MNDLERFKCIVRGEQPDHVPIFGFPGAPGMSRGAMRKTRQRLFETGMPTYAGGTAKATDVASWMRYWGTTGPTGPGFKLESGEEGIRSTSRLEGEFQIIEYESGALTRQVLDNDETYSMPEFIRYHVRDRESWEFYRERHTPRRRMAPDGMEARCRKHDGRDYPLSVGGTSGYGAVRGLMGPEAASIAFYDDPELVHDIVAWRRERVREYRLPLIERLKPEIVQCGEDCCYNHGMLVSPRMFEAFFGDSYREVCDCARANGAELVAVDTDGNISEFTPMIESFGVNAIFPCEVKAGNDLFELGAKHPEFVFFGWLEKESVNEGNEAMIEPEIMGKVPRLLERGRYFPNGDHGLQPLVTFPNLCRFMTLLHEACGNADGDFPRVKGKSRRSKVEGRKSKVRTERSKDDGRRADMRTVCTVSSADL
ncbi:MAG: hypothetical protein JXR37_31280 [Kiritimatiellae bacterium]|nr:hypothetical protein [Kiritimatiellia bacterium]